MIQLQVIYFKKRGRKKQKKDFTVYIYIILLIILNEKIGRNSKKNFKFKKLGEKQKT